jgi:integrase
MNIHHLLDRYLAELEDEGRNGTLPKLRSQLKPLRRLLGDLETSALTYEVLEGYRSERRGELTIRGGKTSHSTINRELTYLRAALRRLQGEAPRIRMRPEENHRVDYWTRPQFDRVVKALDRRGHPDLADLLRWFWTTGWRRREALELTWDEVRWDADVVVLPAARNKSRQDRVLPIEGELRRILKRRLEARDGAYIFHYRGHRRTDYSRALRTALKDAGCPGLLIHGLRRTLARRHLIAGIAPSVTMAIAGWKSDHIYRRYAIRDEPVLRAGLKKAEESS